jgi:predicted nuclease of predicted toxin-antitoxin system
MKLLFDQNISYRIISKISSIFPNSIHVSEVGLVDKDDSDIWLFAQKENYTIVTFDSDFYDISLVNGCPPKIIWLRIGNASTDSIIKVLSFHYQQIYDFITLQSMNEISCLEID